MATVRNKTNQPVAIPLEGGAGFHFAPGETRQDFPDEELQNVFFLARVNKRELLVIPAAPTRKK